MHSVSLYIPCFNGARDIKEAIEAALAQTYPVKEFFLIDDGSTDESVSIASNFPVTIISHPVNKGLAASRNSALGAAKGEFLAGIDADTIVSKNWLETLMAVFETEDDTLAGVGGRLVERYGATIADSWRKRVMAQHHGAITLENRHLFGCNSLLRRSVVESLGGFNEACQTSFDDIDLSERILKAGYRTKYIPKALCFHCRRDTQSSIAESAYRWRVPPFEMKGVFENTNLLAAKWITEIRAGIQEIEDLEKEGSYWLLYISFYSLFHSILVDLIELNRRRPNNENLSALQLGYALLLRCVWQMRGVSEFVKSETVDRLTKRVTDTELSTAWVGALRGLAEESRSSDELYQKFSNRSLSLSPEFAAVLLTSLGQLPTSLSFRPKICEDIAHSLELVVIDEKFNFYTAPGRGVIVASLETLQSERHSNEIKKVVETYDNTNRPYRILFLSDELWAGIELEHELHTINPDQITFLFSPEEAKTVHILTARLRERHLKAQLVNVPLQ